MELLGKTDWLPVKIEFIKFATSVIFDGKTILSLRDIEGWHSPSLNTFCTKDKNGFVLFFPTNIQYARVTDSGNTQTTGSRKNKRLEIVTNTTTPSM